MSNATYCEFCGGEENPEDIEDTPFGLMCMGCVDEHTCDDCGCISMDIEFEDNKQVCSGCRDL